MNCQQFKHPEHSITSSIICTTTISNEQKRELYEQNVWSRCYPIHLLNKITSVSCHSHRLQKENNPNINEVAKPIFVILHKISRPNWIRYISSFRSFSVSSISWSLHLCLTLPTLDTDTNTHTVARKTRLVHRMQIIVIEIHEFKQKPWMKSRFQVQTRAFFVKHKIHIRRNRNYNWQTTKTLALRVHVKQKYLFNENASQSNDIKNSNNSLITSFLWQWPN